jgi:hypothetical protein
MVLQPRRACAGHICRLCNGRKNYARLSRQPVTAAHSRDDKIRQLAKVIVTFEMGMGTIGAYSHAAIAIDAFDGGYGVVFADFTVRVQGSNSLASVEGAAGLGRLDEALYGESCRRAGGCQSCATGHSAPGRYSCSCLACWPCR